eukprot:3472315-Pleurochrysis_carterae.AAC.3
MLRPRPRPRSVGSSARRAVPPSVHARAATGTTQSTAALDVRDSDMLPRASSVPASVRRHYIEAASSKQETASGLHARQS